jgi:hypothetical protein
MKKLLLAAALFAAFATPAAGAGDAPPPSSSLTGQVLEVIDVQSYTYLRLKTSQGETWAAVNKSPVKKGSQVTIYDPAVMENFRSPTLNRTFPQIVFGRLGAASPASSATAPASSAPAHPGTDFGQIHAGRGKSIEVGPIRVAKAEGATARTVAEVNANRLALKGKIVTVRAKVVKVNANVMGRNWVHLRDGSGSASDSSNDLLVTSEDAPNVGDVVTARGVVKADVDLGSGYAYKVLLESVAFGK